MTQTAAWREARWAVEELHAAYCEVLDRGNVEAWPAFFTEDAVYRVIARNNVDAGMPLCLMLCEGMGMLKDRAYAIAHTSMFVPRYVRHHVSLVRVTDVNGDRIAAEANYMVQETLVDAETKLLQAGCYRDVFVRAGDSLLIRERSCIYDTVVVPNCVVYPV